MATYSAMTNQQADEFLTQHGAEVTNHAARGYDKSEGTIHGTGRVLRNAVRRSQGKPESSDPAVTGMPTKPMTTWKR